MTNQTESPIGGDTEYRLRYDAVMVSHTVVDAARRGGDHNLGFVMDQIHRLARWIYMGDDPMPDVLAEMEKMQADLDRFNLMQAQVSASLSYHDSPYVGADAATAVDGLLCDLADATKEDHS